MQTRRTPLLTILLALVLLLAAAGPALALDSVETRTVRVGFYHTDGYHVMDEEGRRSGYGYEVLQAMKLYANWTYEYVGYDLGWPDIQQMLLDGEIDMVVSAVKTPARMEIFDFSARSLSRSGACLMVKAGESPYVAGQYGSYNGMRIGFIENAAHIASTEAFAAEHGFTFTPVYYKTSSELESAILSGQEVDAIATSNMRLVAGTRRLEMYAMQDVHAMVQKGNRELLAEIDYAMEQISLYHPGLYDSLYSKYYSLDAGDQVFFTPEESRFIAQCQAQGQVLQVALAPDASPYSYFDGDQPAGILYEIASEILRRTGLESRLVATPTDAEYRALIESGGVDLRLAARFDYNYAEALGYTLTDPYYTTDVSRVTRKDHEGAVDSVAVVPRSTIESFYLPSILRDETIRYYDTVSDCVAAVLDGSCDALYLFTRSAQEVVYNDETNRLTSVVMPRFAVSFSIGVREDVDARLASILAKSAASLSEDDISALVLKYTNYSTPPLTLRGLLYNSPLLMMALVALGLVLIFGGVMLVFITRKRRQERERNLQLQTALDLAERANSAKSVFMSRMSHEIRTPLNAIIGYNTISSSKLAAAHSVPEYRQAATQIMDCLTKSDVASKHLLTVVNDVLDMSAIESGKIKIAHEPFDFKGLISGLTLMFYSQARSGGVDFAVHFATPVDEHLVGDQMRLNQILTNLLSNAIKFTSVGGEVRLTISQRAEDENRARLRFEVADSGIGMEQDFLERIWAPFEQADASISRRFGGTGLGLSITKNLVDLMGGTIVVASQPQRGSTFTVELMMERREQPRRELIQDFSHIRALVVDDDLGACDYLRLLLDRSGVRCAVRNTAEDALTALAAAIHFGDPFTLCLLDWRMPGSDGTDTVSRIRELAGDKLPIIVISAYDLSEIEPEARQAGVNSFVAKPLFQSTVFDLLANVSGQQAPKPRIQAERPDFGGARVLLAEDNQMNMEIAKAILVSWRLVVDEAWNGQQAADLFCQSPAGTYRAILMDVHMPEMDGHSATRLIRASGHPQATSVPVIAMTADVFAQDVANAMAAGMNAHIGKPIEKSILLETLRRFIND